MFDIIKVRMLLSCVLNTCLDAMPKIHAVKEKTMFNQR